VQVSGATWNAGAPMKLFSGHYFSGSTAGRTYDVSPDGQQFLMIKAPGTDGGLAPSALIVVQHWDEELKRLVPTKCDLRPAACPDQRPRSITPRKSRSDA